MAAKNTTQIDNMDLTPPSRIDPRTWMGRSMKMVGTLEKDAADDSGNVFRFFRVHSSWVPVSLTVLNDAIATVTNEDLGLFDIRGGAEADHDVFAAGVTLATANLGEVLRTSAAGRLNVGSGFQIWQWLGLSEDSDQWYDLALTINSAAANGGTISMIGEFLTGS